MSRDEILKMEAGREIEVLMVKKVMPSTVGSYPYYSEHYGKAYIRTSAQSRARRWRPSEDIADAWDVVEMMRNKVIYKYPVCPNIIYHHTDGLWHCEYFSGDWMRNATAPTAPLAICRAALLAVMEFDG